MKSAKGRSFRLKGYVSFHPHRNLVPSILELGSIHTETWFHPYWNGVALAMKRVETILLAGRKQKAGCGQSFTKELYTNGNKDFKRR